MGSANVEFARSLFAAWECGDFSSVEWADPEIEFVIADGPAAGSWRGMSGLAKGFREIVRGAETFRTHADEYRELDDERVLVFHHISGRGGTSGMDLGRIGSEGVTLFHTFAPAR